MRPTPTIIAASVVCAALRLASAVEAAETVHSEYPGLASGVLTHARLGDPPGDALLKSGDVTLTREDVQKSIDEAPGYVRDDLQKNAFFMLEQLAAERLLLALASQELGDDAAAAGEKSERQLVREYLDGLLKDITVTEEEVEAFYRPNKAMFGGAELDAVRDTIRSFLLDRKKGDRIEEYLRGLGKKRDIVVSAAWTKSRAATALDNPVNEARAADKPALVAFSSAGCCGPDEVAPLLNAVRGKWDEALSIVYIDAARDPVLAARYNVRTVPTLVVYDKQGKETARWNRAVGLDVLAEEFKEAGIESGGTH